MPVLTPGQPVTQDEPLLLVENKLKPGRYLFQLVVADDSGLESDPAQMMVTVLEPVTPPTPTPTGPGRVVLRPDILTDRLRVTRPINPRILRPLRPK
jgi:hypothetical protein